MTGAEQVALVWKECGIQALVLLSFTIQLTLLILAEFRRHINSSVLRFILWSAYQLADSTAIYVLGHMSVTSMSSPKHDLVAFWAPFLLLHLGGQDNITAYAIEDSRLWLRHLQTMVVQVAAAAYILYKSSILISSHWSSSSALLPATVLMLVLGVVKYAERVWALRCAGNTPSGSNYRQFGRLSDTYSRAPRSVTSPRDKEALIFLAHLELDFPMDVLKGPLASPTIQYLFINDEYCHWGDWIGGLEEVYKVVEIQASLMHDVLYTKAEVMATWYGLGIRIFSPLATTAALLLFQYDHHKVSAYSRLDVCVSYVLLAGAVVLETTSLVRAVFSSWTTYGLMLFLPAWTSRLMDAGASLRRLVRAEGWTTRCSWSRSMGQHNLLRQGARSKFSRRSMIARWMGLEDPWNVMAYSWSIPVSPLIVKLVVKQVKSWRPDHHVICTQGQEALKRWGLYDGFEWSLEESILAWHIATDVYLYWYNKEQAQGNAGAEQQQAELAKAVEALSNYMLYLLAARPDMLPPPARRSVYVELCYWIAGLQYGDAKGLVERLQDYGTTPLQPQPPNWGRQTPVGTVLGQKLIGEDIAGTSTTGEMLGLIVQVWAEMLCYVANGCSAYSHAKQLANGGELITIAALLILHVKNSAISISS